VRVIRIKLAVVRMAIICFLVGGAVPYVRFGVVHADELCIGFPP
jgi:hypothetical protein